MFDAFVQLLLYSGNCKIILIGNLTLNKQGPMCFSAQFTCSKVIRGQSPILNRKI